jgi:hypothetical protein
MKYKTYLFKFLVFPENEKRKGEVFVKAQHQGSAPMSAEAVQKATASIVAAHIPEIKPLSANPGTLVRTSEEDSPVQFLRLDEHADVVVWESNERV